MEGFPPYNWKELCSQFEENEYIKDLIKNKTESELLKGDMPPPHRCCKPFVTLGLCPYRNICSKEHWLPVFGDAPGVVKWVQLPRGVHKLTKATTMSRSQGSKWQKEHCKRIEYLAKEFEATFAGKLQELQQLDDAFEHHWKSNGPPQGLGERKKRPRE